MAANPHSLRRLRRSGPSSAAILDRSVCANRAGNRATIASSSSEPCTVVDRQRLDTSGCGTSTVVPTAGASVRAAVGGGTGANGCACNPAVRRFRSPASPIRRSRRDEAANAQKSDGNGIFEPANDVSPVEEHRAVRRPDGPGVVVYGPQLGSSYTIGDSTPTRDGRRGRHRSAQRWRPL
jgi:hypothetical protein